MLLNSRRTFLKETFLTTAVVVMSGTKLFGAVAPLDTISFVQKDLFPDTAGVPTLKDINALPYLLLVLQHSRVTDLDKNYIRDGVQWLNEEAVEMYNKTYTQLSASQRQSVLKSITQYMWGETWIKTIMTYIYEAMLCDPIYGGNKNEIGWKWLNHTAGKPRPTKALL